MELVFLEGWQVLECVLGHPSTVDVVGDAAAEVPDYFDEVVAGQPRPVNEIAAATPALVLHTIPHPEDAPGLGLRRIPYPEYGFPRMLGAHLQLIEAVGVQVQQLGVDIGLQHRRKVPHLANSMLAGCALQTALTFYYH